MNNVIDLQNNFLSIKQAAEVTGLSDYCLRKMLKDGKLPHIKSGVKTLVNMHLLLAMTDQSNRG